MLALMGSLYCWRGHDGRWRQRANTTRCPYGSTSRVYEVSLLQQAIQQGRCAQQELASNVVEPCCSLNSHAAPMTDPQAGWQGPAAAVRLSRKALVTRRHLVWVLCVLLGLAALLTAAPALLQNGELALQCITWSGASQQQPDPAARRHPPPTFGCAPRWRALILQFLRLCSTHLPFAGTAFRVNRTVAPAAAAAGTNPPPCPAAPRPSPPPPCPLPPPPVRLLCSSGSCPVLRPHQ
jgi:hypothetical protein